MMETSSAKQAKTSVMAINGGSSSVKFALFEVGDSFRRILSGSIERIGLPDAGFAAKGLNKTDNFTRSLSVVNPTCAELMIALLERGPPIPKLPPPAQHES